MAPVSPESVALESLQLLQDTLEYLRRLPMVPLTHAHCQRIEAHLSDPVVVTAKRRAIEIETFSKTRVAQHFGPAGNLLAEVVVTADDVTYRFPEIHPMGDLESMRRGETLKF